MTSLPLCLTGKISHSDAAQLKELALAQIANGGVMITARDLASIEFGAAQVLLGAANTARSLGLPYHLDIGAVPAMDHCLASTGLPDSKAFFTIVPEK